MIKSDAQKQNKPTISQRITGFLNEIKTGTLGIEKKVVQNICEYFLSCGRAHKRPPHELLISIKYTNRKLQIKLFHKADLLTDLSTKELVDFFTGGLGSLPEVEKKITEKVILYLQEISDEQQVHTSELDILIVNRSKLVVVEAFSADHFRKPIPLKTLIQKFNP